MKKNFTHFFLVKLSLLLVAAFAVTCMQAQVATLYNFSQVSGTYTPITGGAVYGTTTTDDQRFVNPDVPLGGTVTTGVGLPIGFNFSYNLQVYDRLAINANGWISFGSSLLSPAVNNASTSAYTPLSSTATTTPAHLRNRVAAVGRDLQAQAGAEIRLETIGSAPNRVCVVQWTNYKRFGTAGTGDNLNFQIRLNESDNSVEVIFGAMTFGTTSNAAHVGLGGAAATDFNNRLTTTNWNATAPGTANTSGCTMSAAVTAPVSGTTFRWVLQPPCAGTPAPGNTTSTANPVCSGVNFTLGISNTNLGLGITYQWYVSTVGATGPWTPVGTSAQTFTTTQTQQSWYYVDATCTNSGLTGSSAVLQVGMENFVNCYCTSNATSDLDEDIGNVTFGALNNTSACGALAPGPGSVPFRYSNYTTLPATPVMQGEVVPFSVGVITCGTTNYTNRTSIFIDWNQDGLFTVPDEAVFVGGTASGPNTQSGNITVPFTAALGVTRMRVVTVETSGTVNPCGTYSWGETEDYLINVTASSACAGTPNPGNTLSSATASCATINFNLSLQNLTTGSGVSYQWFVSAVGASGPWTPVGPNSPFFTTNLSQTSWYYCAVTCSSGPSTGNSTPVQVTLTPANQCYCTPTYTFGKTDGDLIANVEIIGTTLSNNTGTAPVNPAYTYFVAPPANLTGTLQAGTSYPIQVSVGSFGSQNMAVWIDFNENGVFETPGERVGFTTTSIGAFGTATFTLTLPCNPTPGVKRMRVRDVFATAGNLIDPCANYSWGETEDYDVTITPPPPCPVPSNLTATGATLNSINLNWTAGCTETAWFIEYGPVGFTLGTGTIVATTTNSYTITGLSSGTSYHAYVRANCGVNGTSASFGPVTFTTQFPPPPNDLCANAIPLTCNSTVSGTTATGTNTGNGPACTTTVSTAPGVWYTLTGTGTDITASLCGSSFDTKIFVYTGSCGTFTCVTGNDDFCGLQSQVTFATVSGTTYYILVAGFGSASGLFTLNITCALPPENDNVCNATPLPLGTSGPYSNANATTQPGEPVPPGGDCSGQLSWCLGETISHTVWFTVVGPPSGKIKISSVGIDNQLAIYAAPNCDAVTGGGATLLAANDDFNGLSASLNNVCVTPGATYYVQMDGYGTSTGTANLTVTELPNNPPTVICPANVTSCVNTATWNTPTATDPDGCGTPTLTSTHQPGGVFANGITTVTYTATDHAGATGTCTFTVNVAKITATFTTSNYNGFNVSCNGGNNGTATAIPTGGTGHTYLWSNGQTTATATGLSVGSYTITISNAQGCSYVTGVTLNQPSAITCNATSTNANCFGAANGTASATAFGGVGTYTFNWSNGATGANVSGLAAGAYTVSVTDANGCLCTKQVTITQPPALQVVSEEIISSGGPTFYNVYQIVVTGGTLPYGITFNVTGGFANYTVLNGLVDTDGNGTPDAPGSTITVSFQNEAAWTLTLNDANGCAEGTGLVFSNASSAILAITGAAITPDNGTGNGSIALTVAGGVPTCPGYNYQWSGPSNWLGAAVNSPTLSNLPSGWYVVVVTDCSGGQTYAWYWVPKQSRGRGKLAEGESIMAYPNPVTKETTIEFSLNTTEKATIVVYGVDGKAVATLYNNVAEAGELYTIPFTVSDMAAGMYMVTLTTESGMVQHLKLSVMK